MISEYLGFDSDYIILGLAAFCVILFILTVVNMAKTSISANEANEKNIRKMFDNMKFTFQKVGLVKYDAFNEMGGKLSFSLAMLNESDNGFVLNAVHSREGCYTYIKEIIDGNSIITLAEEEQEALKMAKESTGSNPAK